MGDVAMVELRSKDGAKIHLDLLCCFILRE